MQLLSCLAKHLGYAGPHLMPCVKQNFCVSRCICLRAELISVLQASASLVPYLPSSFLIGKFITSAFGRHFRLACVQRA